MGTTDRSLGEESFASLSGPALRSFEEAFAGSVIAPSDSDYDEARGVWNGSIDRYPALIARCTGTSDVVEAVAFAREQGLPVSVRGGGHNVAGTAMGDASVVVDLSEMTGVRVDSEARTVRAAGGATLGDVDRETQIFGLAAPLGAVSQTGIAGLTLGGGYGHLSRQYGLALDALRSVDVVTADGEVRTASDDRNADLFWGLRGGGGSLGVVTSFEYDLHPVGPEVYAFFPWFRVEDADAVMARYREWIADPPHEAGVLAFAAHVPDVEEFPEDRWGEPAFAMLGSYRGDPGDGAEVFAPLLEAAPPIADLSGRTTYLDLQSMLDEDYPDGRRYYWSSIYLAELPDGLLERMLAANDAAPSALSTVDLWHLGGAVADVPREATAFWHREEPHLLAVEANWDDPADDDENRRWARELIADVRDLPAASGRYGNFPGTNEAPARAVYGDNYERLVEVKTRYDPENLFPGNGFIEPQPVSG
ncbi:FAD-binding oxidoreductase [Saliphagus sp. LR7]|uniref:FAD-binding oxidoreductase n=1 Tax=Saliphagus sp. LR7 TaxID=2282654 RepID=UPI000DF7B13F|nr:FAD-binding oxidoreductase [Saliphagus sp. LR7]